MDLEEGDTFDFADGENGSLPGITGFEEYGGARPNGEFKGVGFDTASTSRLRGGARPPRAVQQKL